MSTDIKLSKAQIKKKIQFGGLFHNILGNLSKKVKPAHHIPLARDHFSGLISNLASMH